MCSKSETIGKIAAALVAFSGEVKTIAKDATNPHFKSAYTSLDHMIDETKPLLNQHGLTVMQFPGGDGEKITIRTMILHTSGEWIESEPLTLRAVKIDPQGAGSAITYGRRYSYAAALSLSLGDDDDGNGSSHQPTQPPQTRNTTPASGNSQQSTQSTATPPRTSTSGGTAKSRVYKLREEMGWQWSDLNEFAASVLLREVKYLKDDIKTEEEWKEIESAMLVTKNAAS